QLSAAWTRAMSNLISPRLVQDAPCQEIVIEGAALDRPGAALDALPVPISTPGWDNGPYLTTSAFITKDPETGVQNLGNYRGHVNLAEYNGFMDVTCITRRRDAIFTSFISQLAPSEATVMRQPGQEAIFLRHLRDHIGIKGIKHVHMHMPLIGGYRVLVLQFE